MNKTQEATTNLTQIEKNITTDTGNFSSFLNMKQKTQ